MPVLFLLHDTTNSIYQMTNQTLTQATSNVTQIGTPTARPCHPVLPYHQIR